MKYIGLIVMILIGLVLNSSWDNFKQFITPAAKVDTAATQQVQELLKQTQYSEQDEQDIALTAKHVEKLQQQQQRAEQELAHREMYAKLVGFPIATPQTQSHNVALNQQAKKPRKPRAKRVNSYVVSMIFITTTDRYAVVDGRFVREGERLKGKDEVKSIEEGRITVSQAGKSNVFKIHGASL